MFHLYYCFIFTLFQMGIAQNDIREGAWNVLSIKTLEKDGYEFLFEISRKKLTRTEDAFTAALTFRKVLDDSVQFRAEIYKWVDGGSKLYQLLTDDSFIHFLDKNAKNNTRRCLEMAGMDPPEFPMPKGDYEIKDFVLDYCELPTESPCGKFTANVFMLKDAQEVGGLTIETEFECADDHKCATEE